MERLLEIETRLSGEMVSLREEFKGESLSLRAELSKRLILFEGHIESMNRDILAFKTQQREILDVMREWLRKTT
jgi:hypothetical protein